MKILLKAMVIFVVVLLPLQAVPIVNNTFTGQEILNSPDASFPNVVQPSLDGTSLRFDNPVNNDILLDFDILQSGQVLAEGSTVTAVVNVSQNFGDFDPSFGFIDGSGTSAGFQVANNSGGRGSIGGTGLGLTTVFNNAGLPGTFDITLSVSTNGGVSTASLAFGTGSGNLNLAVPLDLETGLSFFLVGNGGDTSPYLINSLNVTVDGNPIPEPTTYLSLLIGMLFCGFVVRKRKK
ncbi:PEP-CTERM sorting domain-containing protein [Candidatus Uabimicrobium amorphum]|uniref:PEP-CTERM protein-sorting domain-containing protein n=1 Tax=Uabimicrobium amorphum TaxID=2596890 RepID=A0A5S9II63_UABAM|nr:PEP-CTERM sorting domain-containing protein [Candidatus Uabimicrobium amorphum]BBM82000.1 hypothetical protein UABAM_00343 [Candidatus Uabimicrobium amorphum]